MKTRKRCPSCKFDRTYEGELCPVCVSAGIVRKKHDPTDLYIKGCVALVEEIYSDTRALFAETGEKITDKKMIEALTECTMEQANFRGIIMPKNADYDAVEKAVKKGIKAQYFRKVSL